MKITVFGLGYVGSVVAACMAQDGHDVTGVDLDINKVNSINNSESPIVEPQLKEAIAKAVGAGRLRARTSVQEIGDVSFVSVGTPSNENGSFGVSQLLRVAEQIGLLLGRRITSMSLTFAVRSCPEPPKKKSFLCWRLVRAKESGEILASV